MVRAHVFLPLVLVALLSSSPPSAADQLELTVLRIAPDTTWVSVLPPYVNCGVGGWGCPNIWSAHVTVEPCPLNRTCGSGVYSTVVYTSVPDTLALSSYDHYSLGGYYQCDVITWNWSAGSCSIILSSTTTQYQTIDFYAPTPVTRRSWGTVKVLYR
jgi:hypothetical protein